MAHLGPILACVGLSGTFFGLSWACLGLSWACLGLVWAHLEPVLAALGRSWDAFRCSWWSFGRILDASLKLLGFIWLPTALAAYLAGCHRSAHLLQVP